MPPLNPRLVDPIETGSDYYTEYEEATLLHEGMRRRHLTPTAPSGLVNRLSNELYGSKFQSHASSSSLRAADWQQMTQEGTNLDMSSTGTSISREVSSVASGVLFRAIIVDVYRYSGLGLCFGPFATATHPRTDLSASSRARMRFARHLHVVLTDKASTSGRVSFSDIRSAGRCWPCQLTLRSTIIS